MSATVLIPGLLCTSEVFAAQIPVLWQHGPVMVASTLVGTSFEEIARAILAEAPPRFALAGSSMGGYLCFEIMRQAPERVLKLALLSTSARPDTPEQSAQRQALLGQARSGDYAALLSKLTRMLPHPSRRDDPELLAILVRMGLSVGVEGLARQTEAVIGRPDSRADLASISVPTLVLAGDSDPLMPPEHAQEIAAGVPGARLVVVPDCGHAATLERPDAVNLALEAWIA